MRITELHPAPTAAEPLEIPDALLASVTRHQAHLVDLIATLKAAGLDDAMVESSVRTLVDSYADELTVAIRGIMKGPHDE
ncbi:hypothetical protein ASE75_04775 [Sphingomonas sp. Leaf17]|uniref:hypothetical protein n=1 Tax=Sphingomonas sp. Leaf17 TaxID=1735683 RepID=UPI0006F28443|nr:hypothetical protein [Sphingomonas sp. Leaf17]KQM65576.1 hypothetical protein ASE75_04775 [Sphingomonas sp. Leaf17]